MNVELIKPEMVKIEGTNLELLNQISEFIKENFEVLWNNAVNMCDASRDGYVWSNKTLNLTLKRKDYYSSLDRIEWGFWLDKNNYQEVRINQCGVKAVNGYHWEKSCGANAIKDADIQLLANCINSIATPELNKTKLTLTIK